MNLDISKLPRDYPRQVIALKHCFAYAIIYSVVLLTPFPAQANVDQLLELSLEELLNVNVTTATKTSVKVDETPAMVDIITHQQIKQRGYRHLADVLNDIVNNHEDRSNWGIGEPLYQNSGFGFRFDTGQNILLLFNGQRLNAFLPGNRFGGEEYLLDNIDRIEVVRGPGSPLYGANAFTAVVNIISKTQFDENEKPFLKAGVGGAWTSAEMAATGSWKTSMGRRGFLSGAFRVATESGQKLLIRNSLFGDDRVRDGVNYTVDGETFFSRTNFRAYFKMSRQERHTFTGFNGVNPDENDKLRLFMYAYSLGADYTRKLTDRLEIKGQAGWHQDNWAEVALIPFFKINAGGDSLILDEQGNPILDDTIEVIRDGRAIRTPFIMDGQGGDTRTLEGELQLTWNYAKTNNFILGLNLCHDQILKAKRPTEIQLAPFEFVEFQTFTDDANNWLFDLDAARTTLGAYAQIDYALNHVLKFNVGARLDSYSGRGELDETYAEFIPRGGLVYKHDALGSFKLAYGTATRVPNGFETLSSVTILGSPDNRPERIRTFQTVWIKNWSSGFRTEIGGFFSAISNHLTTDANITEQMKAQGFIGRFVNAAGEEKLKNQGIDGKFAFKTRAMEAFVNFTQYFKSDDGAGEQIGYIPERMINANVNIPLNWFNLNVGANYRGNFTQPDADSRPHIKDYLLLNANVLAKPSSLPFEIQAGARNLLDAEIRYPASSTSFTHHFPGRGIEIWSAIGIKL